MVAAASRSATALAQTDLARVLMAKTRAARIGFAEAIDVARARAPQTQRTSGVNPEAR